MNPPDTTAETPPGRESGAAPLVVHAGGEGPPLVLLHGWAMNSAAWGPVLETLEARRRVVRIDLPGHGASAALPAGAGLDEWLEAVLAAAPERAMWLGWSLGGMLALAAAAHAPARVEKLVLVAASPKFTASGDWPHAVERPVWNTFINDFFLDPEPAVERFLKLQAVGAESPAAVSRKLAAGRAAGGPGALDKLTAGLALLGALDLRDELKRLDCPVTAVLGGGDRLVPEAAGADMRVLAPGLEVRTVAGAGHAPFVSQPRAFLEAVEGL